MIVFSIAIITASGSVAGAIDEEEKAQS